MRREFREKNYMNCTHFPFPALDAFHSPLLNDTHVGGKLKQIIVIRVTVSICNSISRPSKLSINAVILEPCVLGRGEKRREGRNEGQPV